MEQNQSTSDVLSRRLRRLAKRPQWYAAGGAGLVFLICGGFFVCESLEIQRSARRLALVDNGICSSIADLQVLQARHVTLGRTIVELAADGQQEMPPAWRSVGIQYRQHGQEFHGSIQNTMTRLHAEVSRHAGLKGFKAQLFELAELQERVQNDILTIVRLADEGRSDDIAVMHTTIDASHEAVAEQLENLSHLSQITLLNSAKQIQRAGYRVFWSGVGSILFGTLTMVVWWSNRRGAADANVVWSETKTDTDTDPDPLQIPAEQALTERFLLRGVHVLVAEDDIASRRLLARVFENAGAVVTIACDGGHALRQFRKAQGSGHPVQLVIMDLKMPVMDGLQVVMQLRDLDYFDGPVLALTEANSPATRAECLEAGFDDYLAKPIDRQRLLQLATDYLGKTAPA